MRKLLTFLIALGAIVFGVCSPAGAQLNGCNPGFCVAGRCHCWGLVSTAVRARISIAIKTIAVRYRILSPH